MNIVVIGILACEIGFWLVLTLGLAVRYLMGWRRLSTVLLLCVPILDVLLLSLIAWDLLGNGTTADFTHGLGAVYLGLTVAFGHQIIARVDAWVAHRFADGPVPEKPPKLGSERVKHEWRQWFRMLLCAVIASAVLWGITLIVDDASRTIELIGWVARVWLATGIWLIGWPVWYSVSHALRRPAGLTS